MIFDFIERIYQNFTAYIDIIYLCYVEEINSYNSISFTIYLKFQISSFVFGFDMCN